MFFKKLLLKKNMLPENTYQTIRLCAHWGWKYRKYIHVQTIACCSVESMQTGKRVSSVVQYGTSVMVMISMMKERRKGVP